MMMSQPSYQFDADDVAIGRDAAIFARAGKRLLLRNVNRQQLSFLQSVGDAAFASTALDKSLFDELKRHGLIVDASGSQRKAKSYLRIPSSVVTRLGQLFAWAIEPISLIAMIMILVIGLISLPSVFAWQFSISEVITSTELSTFLSVFFLYLLTSCFHELGHATACLKLTGVVGGIRFCTYRFLPAMAADVSSVCLTNSRGRAMIALAGSAFQGVLGCCLLLLPFQNARLAGAMALLAASFSLLPLPRADGYWFLRDLFDIKLAPRLFRLHARVSAPEVFYGVFLIGVVLLLDYGLMKEANSLLQASFKLYNDAFIRSVISGLLGFYLIVVLIVFSYKNLVLFGRSDES